MLQFIWPWFFYLLPLPVIIRYILPAVENQQTAALHVPFLDDFKTDSNNHQQTRSGKEALLLGILIWLLFIIAGARPQWLGEPVELPISGRDLMMAIDLSGSMQIEDFSLQGRTVNRLTATKAVAGDFIQRRESDRIGLILFGEQAYVQAPLTFDRKTVHTLLNEAFLGLAGEKTAIGDAIGLAIKRLKQNPESSRVLILLTDGQNTAGEIDPIQAAEIAASSGLKIYAIGIGADKMTRRSFFGFSRTVNPSADLDEETLKTIAEKTQGQYFRAHNIKELEKIYGIIDTLEPIEKETESFRPTTALYYWPLAIALLLSSVLLILYTRGRIG